MGLGRTGPWEEGIEWIITLGQLHMVRGQDLEQQALLIYAMSCDHCIIH